MINIEHIKTTSQLLSPIEILQLRYRIFSDKIELNTSFIKLIVLNSYPSLRLELLQ